MNRNSMPASDMLRHEITRLENALGSRRPVPFRCGESGFTFLKAAGRWQFYYYCETENLCVPLSSAKISIAQEFSSLAAKCAGWMEEERTRLEQASKASAALICEAIDALGGPKA